MDWKWRSLGWGKGIIPEAWTGQWTWFQSRSPVFFDAWPKVVLPGWIYNTPTHPLPKYWDIFGIWSTKHYLIWYSHSESISLSSHLTPKIIQDSLFQCDRYWINDNLTLKFVLLVINEVELFFLLSVYLWLACCHLSIFLLLQEPFSIISLNLFYVHFPFGMFLVISVWITCLVC